MSYEEEDTCMSYEEEDTYLDIEVPAVVKRPLSSFSAPMRVGLPFVSNEGTVGGVRPLNAPHHIQVVLVCQASHGRQEVSHGRQEVSHRRDESDERHPSGPNPR
jgi:hypothetical protein